MNFKSSYKSSVLADSEQGDGGLTMYAISSLDMTAYLSKTNWEVTVRKIVSTVKEGFDKKNALKGFSRLLGDIVLVPADIAA